ncbi:uncharacterized protein BO80DRAFT_447790 [Aspergillus ibericus CBS 121593]|uniref:Uncharacterized protein n=1 Tax=Aspergillus ibericus CBS 121593 TaxID=1448316 RepID=A0A395GRL5_9EURO|nr:hypothetical protein BO80DRAFT_447790 [Aspergillus ibericus CBS 121593]RAK98185.1 hypothetical protein BO80DRAFT_447790 [Aspergillus ibericus CBS 121593]
MAQSSNPYQPQTQQQTQAYPSVRQATRKKQQNPLGDYAAPNTSTALQPVRRTMSPSPSVTEDEAIDIGETASERARGKLARQATGQDMTQMPEQEDTGLKLRLDLNLDVEVELKAKIHGDITLALL